MSTTLEAMARTKGAVHDHNNIKGFFGEYRFLSNFELVQILYSGIVYPSVENAYMAQKTLDIPTRKTIALLAPNEAKKLGRSIQLRHDWEVVKEDIMYQLNLLKFRDNAVLRNKLLMTGDKYLEETNWWNDTEWGVCNGEGNNKLGKILMRIRGELKL